MYQILPSILLLQAVTNLFNKSHHPSNLIGTMPFHFFLNYQLQKSLMLDNALGVIYTRGTVFLLHHIRGSMNYFYGAYVAKRMGSS